jgi:hypothetical protein
VDITSGAGRRRYNLDRVRVTSEVSNQLISQPPSSLRRLLFDAPLADRAVCSMSWGVELSEWTVWLVE